ncbi:MAG: hypothetical protein Q8L88_02530 [Bacteroidota bacterium]|nr:hypothetical protein [Bacteroidota bacterium]
MDCKDEPIQPCTDCPEPVDTTKPPVVDTTIQNFTFETLEFGDGFESSEFNDVWVFDENNILAVGYISDSLFGKKNIMHWNGSTWNPLGRQFNSAGIYGVWAKDTSEIYYASGVVLQYKNGEYVWVDFSEMDFSGNRAVTKLWGSGNQNVYGVGPWGTIVHYDGNKWTQIEFDRQWYFYGITGNKETGAAYAMARNMNHVTTIIELKNLSASIIYQSTEGDNNSPGSWTINYIGNNELTLADYRVWNFNTNNHTIKIRNNLSLGVGILTMTSLTENDVYFFGSQSGGIGKFIHFNGKRFKEFDIPLVGDNYGGSSCQKDIAVYARFSSNKAVLTMVRRKY